jgi:Na+-translocating ferredoxin:NAD+ oxidoreductase subunit G
VESWSESGYIGNIRLLVGFDTDGIIKGIEVLEHDETPGYGDLIENARSDFNLQFVGRDPSREVLKIKKDGGVIDAISGATVTSEAYCEAVQIAWKVLNEGSPD